jgi:excisionase family DNA binding protein
VGVGGVWNWLNHGEAIEDLKAIDWDGRECTIIPDSDVFRRNDLLRAIYALGRELRTAGANVYLTELPQTGSSKTGLDDFLVAGGEIDSLETYRLDHRRFKGLEFWHQGLEAQKIIEGSRVRSAAVSDQSDTPRRAKPQIPQPGQMYAVSQVAYRLQVSDSTIIRMIESGALPAICIRSGKRKKIFRVREEALEKWITSKEREGQRASKPAA